MKLRLIQWLNLILLALLYGFLIVAMWGVLVGCHGIGDDARGASGWWGEGAPPPSSDPDLRLVDPDYLIVAETEAAILQ